MEPMDKDRRVPDRYEPGEGCLTTAVRLPVRIVVLVLVMPVRLVWDAPVAPGRAVHRTVLVPLRRGLALLWHTPRAPPWLWSGWRRRLFGLWPWAALWRYGWSGSRWADRDVPSHLPPGGPGGPSPGYLLKPAGPRPWSGAVTAVYQPPADPARTGPPAWLVRSLLRVRAGPRWGPGGGMVRAARTGRRVGLALGGAVAVRPGPQPPAQSHRYLLGPARAGPRPAGPRPVPVRPHAPRALRRRHLAPGRGASAGPLGRGLLLALARLRRPPRGLARRTARCRQHTARTPAGTRGLWRGSRTAAREAWHTGARAAVREGARPGCGTRCSELPPREEPARSRGGVLWRLVRQP